MWILLLRTYVFGNWCACTLQLRNYNGVFNFPRSDLICIVHVAVFVHTFALSILHDINLCTFVLTNAFRYKINTVRTQIFIKPCESHVVCATLRNSLTYLKVSVKLAKSKFYSFSPTFLIYQPYLYFFQFSAFVAWNGAWKNFDFFYKTKAKEQKEIQVEDISISLVPTRGRSFSNILGWLLGRRRAHLKLLFGRRQWTAAGGNDGCDDSGRGTWSGTLTCRSASSASADHRSRGRSWTWNISIHLPDFLINFNTLRYTQTDNGDIAVE